MISIRTLPSATARGRTQAGLTTLEWLLIVAAVAALAALAVVLIGNVVGNTAEQVQNHSARQQAADLAATQITQHARHETPADGDEAKRINAQAQRRCQQIAITYADVLGRTQYKGGHYDPSVPGWNPMPGHLPKCTIHPR